MAAQTSLNRINSYARVLGKNCFKQRILILVLCGFTVLFYCFEFVAFNNVFFSGSHSFMVYAQMVCVAAGLSGVLLMPAIFRELYNRQFADVEFSLPLSASERFRVKLMIILKNHILPYVAAMTVVLIVGLAFVPSEYTSQLFSIYFVALSRVMFVDAISLVCISCCGCIIECIYTPVLFGAAVSFIPVLFAAKFICFLSGKEGALHYTDNPIGFIGASEIFTSDTELSYLDGIWVSALISILLSAGLVFLAFCIYRKRDGLSVGKPFVFKSFARIFTCTVSLAVIMIFFLDSLYNSILFGLLAYLAICISSKRKKLVLRDIEFSLLGYIACLASVILVGFAAYMTSGFGYARMAIPEEFNEDCETLVYAYHANSDRVRDWNGYISREQIEQLFSEVEAMDQRHDRSFSENISFYYKLIKNGISGRESMGTGNTIQVVCTDPENDYSYVSMSCEISEEEQDAYIRKLKERGIELIYFYDEYYDY